MHEVKFEKWGGDGGGGGGVENKMVQFEVNSWTQLMMEKAKEKQREGVHCLHIDILTPECFR